MSEQVPKSSKKETPAVLKAVVDFIEMKLQERREYRNKLIGELVEPYPEQWWEKKYGITSQAELHRRRDLSSN